MHLYRMQKFGSTDEPPKGRRPSRRTICTICGEEEYAKGFCRLHYARNTRTNGLKVCSQCESPAIARGMCSNHYNNWRRWSDEFPECPVDGCANPVAKGGLCDTHYARLRRSGSLVQNVGRSAAERDIFDFVQTIASDAISGDRKITAPYELDVYVPSRNLAIEFNGLYWHNEDHVGKEAHLNKYQLCRDAGIQLVQVWEDEWARDPELVKRMLARKLGVVDRRVGARKTELVSVSVPTAKAFLTANHIQGFSGGTHYTGLALGNDLVALGVWKRRADGSCELIRYAASLTVSGGLQKMMKSLPYKKFVTFADHCVSDGKLYEATGWVADKELPPDYRYVVGGERVHKFSYRLKRFRGDPNLEYVDGLTERELAELNGLSRIWDAGKTRYLLDTSPDDGLA